MLSLRCQYQQCQHSSNIDRKCNSWSVSAIFQVLKSEQSWSNILSMLFISMQHTTIVAKFRKRSINILCYLGNEVHHSEAHHVLNNSLKNACSSDADLFPCFSSFDAICSLQPLEVLRLLHRIRQFSLSHACPSVFELGRVHVSLRLSVFYSYS